MVDIKNTLKAAFVGCKAWSRQLWKAYVLLAVAAAVLVYALMRISASTLMPIWAFGLGVKDWELILSIIGLDVVWSIVLVVALVATIVASVFAHKAMKAFVRGFDKKELGRSRRNVLAAYAVLMLLGTVAVAFLPTVVLFVSYVAAALSGMMYDEVASPAWVHIATLLCTAVGVLLCEVVATFVRLCYREIPAAAPTAEVAEDAEMSDSAATQVAAVEA